MDDNKLYAITWALFFTAIIVVVSVFGITYHIREEHKITATQEAVKAGVNPLVAACTYNIGYISLEKCSNLASPK